MYSLKHDLLKQPLELKKTHDLCVSGKPKLAVVFIHGIASDSSTFTNALKYLEGTTSLKDVRFVTFDLLGSGKSYASDKLNYNYKEQIEALHNSIEKLKLDTPLVLVGHSMGTFIVTRYADTYKKSCKRLILVSAPVYTEKDLESPAFAAAIKIFEDAVSVKNRKILKEKAFQNSMKNIVMNKGNYKRLSEITTKTTIIFGLADQFIAAFNMPKLLKSNTKYLSAIQTPGRHGVSHDKYSKILNVLEEVLNENL